jgi:Tfp pilus assembly PilM family ATPase
MALFGRKKKTVGLDIGSGLIKLVVIEHGKDEPELSKVAITPVLADAIVEGEVMDPGIVADAIRGLFVTGGVKQKQVVTAVGGRDVIVKKIQMDRMKETDAREVIRWGRSSTCRSTWRTSSWISRSSIRTAKGSRWRCCWWRPSASWSRARPRC